MIVTRLRGRGRAREAPPKDFILIWRVSGAARHTLGTRMAVTGRNARTGRGIAPWLVPYFLARTPHHPQKWPPSRIRIITE